MEKHCIRLPSKFDFHHHRVFNQDLEVLLAHTDLKEIEL